MMSGNVRNLWLPRKQCRKHSLNELRSLDIDVATTNETMMSNAQSLAHAFNDNEVFLSHGMSGAGGKVAAQF